MENPSENFTVKIIVLQCLLRMRITIVWNVCHQVGNVCTALYTLTHNSNPSITKTLLYFEIVRKHVDQHISGNVIAREHLFIIAVNRHVQINFALKLSSSCIKVV